MVDQLFAIITIFLKKKVKKKQNEEGKAIGINPPEESELDWSQKTVWNDSERLT